MLEVARWVHDELETLRVPAVPKTSGSSGLHIYVPLPPATSYQSGQLFCQIVATVVASRHPKVATVERTVRARPRGTVYVDFLQNILGKTLATAYSARASDFAGVSTPLTWEEVHAGVDPKDFTIKTAPARFHEMGDLWARLRKTKPANLESVFNKYADWIVRVMTRGPRPDPGSGVRIADPGGEHVRILFALLLVLFVQVFRVLELVALTCVLHLIGAAANLISIAVVQSSASRVEPWLFRPMSLLAMNAPFESRANEQSGCHGCDIIGGEWRSEAAHQRTRRALFGVGRLTRHLFICLGPDCTDLEIGERTWVYLKSRMKELEHYRIGRSVLSDQVPVLADLYGRTDLRGLSGGHLVSEMSRQRTPSALSRNT